jgi:hypothetical protein
VSFFTAPQKPCHLVERALCGGESDALNPGLTLVPVPCSLTLQGLEALEREREVRASFGWHQRMNFIDDHRVHRPKGVARIRREEQVQRFWCGDENVGWSPEESGALDGRRIPGTNRNRRLVICVAPRHCPIGDSGEGGAEVAFDVNCERLQRREVQDAAAGRLRRHRVEHQAVDAPEKGGQRFAAAGGREDQGGISLRDCRPSLLLGRCGGLERCAEPLGYGRLEERQNVGMPCHVFYFSGCVDPRRISGHNGG